jgi:head-tail adaptor
MFRHHFHVQNYTASVDDYGQPTKSWSTLTHGQLTGHIESADGSQIDAVDVARGQIRYRVVIPHIGNVTTKSRLLLKEAGKADRIFQVVGVVDTGLRRMQLELDCLETVA